MMALYPVLRNGTTSHVNFTLTAVGTVSLDEALGDGHVTSRDVGSAAADGLQLVDGKHSKVYLVASDSRGRCLCSRWRQGLNLDNDAPVLFSATFAAPPADVTRVDVHIPSFGTVADVPVQ